VDKGLTLWHFLHFRCQPDFLISLKSRLTARLTKRPPSKHCQPKISLFHCSFGAEMARNCRTSFFGPFVNLLTGPQSGHAGRTIPTPTALTRHDQLPGRALTRRNPRACPGGLPTKAQAQAGQLFPLNEYIAPEIGRHKATLLIYLLQTGCCDPTKNFRTRTCCLVDHGCNARWVTVDGSDSVLK